MKDSEHLSAELKSTYLDGTTTPGETFAVASHLAFCERCRNELGMSASAWASSGLPPVLGDARAFLEALAKRDVRALPQVPNNLRGGSWRRIAAGVRVLPLRGVCGLGEAVYLVKAEAGALLALPESAALVVVLRGSVEAGGLYTSGDVLEVDEPLRETASGGADVGCVCLVIGDDELYAT